MMYLRSGFLSKKRPLLPGQNLGQDVLPVAYRSPPFIKCVQQPGSGTAARGYV